MPAPRDASVVQRERIFNRLVGYAARMFLTNTATGLITFFVTMYAARVREKSAVGEYNTYMLIYGVIQTAAISGVNATIQKHAADDETKQHKFGALAYQLFLVLTVILAPIGAGVGMMRSWSLSLAVFGAPWVIITWWGRYISRSRFDSRREAMLMAVASLSKSVIQLAFFAFTDYEDVLIYGDFLALIVAGALAMISIPRTLGTSVGRLLHTEVDNAFLSGVARFITPLWIGGQVYAGASYVQGFFTRLVLGAAHMGTYSLAASVWQFAYRPMEYLGQAALPGLVKAPNRGKLYLEIQRFCLLTFPLIGIVVANGSPLLLEVMGLREKWADVPELLMLTALNCPSAALQMSVSQLVTAEGKPKLILRGMVMQVMVVTAAIYPAGTTFGLYGVMLVNDLGVAANALTLVHGMWKDQRDSVSQGLTWTIASTIFTGACVAGGFLLREWRFSWVMSAVGALAYLAMTALYKMLTTADVDRLRAAIPGLKAGARP